MEQNANVDGATEQIRMGLDAYRVTGTIHSVHTLAEAVSRQFSCNPLPKIQEMMDSMHIDTHLLAYPVGKPTDEQTTPLRPYLPNNGNEEMPYYLVVVPSMEMFEFMLEQLQTDKRSNTNALSFTGLLLPHSVQNEAI